MADILDFRPTEGKSGRRNGRSHSAGCEIVIFPGVRYEHWERKAGERKAETPMQDKPKQARRRVKRDTLEIMD